MKYILGPFFKYLWLSIELLLQIILATLLTIIWGIPTLILSILYFIFVSIWEFKLCFYKCCTWKTKSYNDSITYYWLWAKHQFSYKSYFYRIWNLTEKTPVIVQITQKINNKLNLN